MNKAKNVPVGANVPRGTSASADANVPRGTSASADANVLKGTSASVNAQFDVAYHLGFCPNCWKETAQEELPDGTERAAESRDEITGHDGLFGVERQAWQGCQENIKGSQANVPAGTPGMLPSM